MNRTVLALSVAMFFTSSCGNSVTCGDGTTLMGTTCVANQVMMDAGSTKMCGAHTTDTGTTCDVGPSACSTGTMYDATLHVCTPPMQNFGTLVVQQNFKTAYPLTFHQATTDAGMMYVPVGQFNMPDPSLQGTELLYMADGRPLGSRLIHIGTAGVLPPADMPTAFDHQATLAEYQQCSGTVSFYKPTTGKNYRMITTLQGCFPNFMYSLWFIHSPDDPTSNTFNDGLAFVDRTLFTAAGGLPAILITDASGQAQADYQIDPTKYFQAGANCDWCLSHTNAKTIPTNGALFVANFYHANLNSNGNAGLCPETANDTCATQANECVVAPPFPEFQIQPGKLAIDSGLQQYALFKLSDLQPF